MKGVVDVIEGGEGLQTVNVLQMQHRCVANKLGWWLSPSGSTIRFARLLLFQTKLPKSQSRKHKPGRVAFVWHSSLALFLLPLLRPHLDLRPRDQSWFKTTSLLWDMSWARNPSWIQFWHWPTRYQLTVGPFNVSWMRYWSSILANKAPSHCKQFLASFSFCSLVLSYLFCSL